MSTLRELLLQDDSADEAVIPAPAVKTAVDEALLGPDGNDPLPASTLMLTLDKVYHSFNNFVSDYFPAPTAAMHTSQNDMKDMAEQDVKILRDACNELSAEFTKTSAEWQLRLPEEAYEDEAKDLEKAIKRQEELIKRAEGQLKTQTKYYAESLGKK